MVFHDFLIYFDDNGNLIDFNLNGNATVADFNGFRLIFDSAVTVDIILQIYNLLVMYIATPKTMNEYRYYLYLQTMGMMFFFCSTMICAQHLSYFYRLVVVMFADNDRAIRNFNRPRSKLMGVALILVISGVIGLAVHEITLDYEDYLKNEANNDDDPVPYWCVATNGLRPMWISLMGAIFLLSQVLNLAGGILIIRMIKATKQKLSPATYKMHLQLSVLLLIQGLLPIVFVLSPIVAMLLWVINHQSTTAPNSNWQLSDNIFIRIGARSMQASLVLLGMFPMVNAILIIAFIKPYRMFFVQLYQQIRIPRICKTRSNAVEALPQRRIDETFSQTRG